MNNCGKLVAGGPCMRPPGHGGSCFSGHLIPVEDPDFAVNPMAWITRDAGQPRFWRIFWRLFWQALKQRETIRDILLYSLVAIQVGIDFRLIFLWK